MKTQEDVTAERLKIKAEIADLVALEVDSLMSGGDVSRQQEIAALRYKYGMLEEVSNSMIRAESARVVAQKEKGRLMAP